MRQTDKNNTLVLFVLGLLAGIAFLYFAKTFWFGIHSLDSAQTEKRLIHIHSGHRPNELAVQLQEAGIISDAKEFLFLGKILRKWKNLKVGEYALSPSQSPIEIFSIITSGISAATVVTVSEGKNLYQIAQQLQELGLDPQQEAIPLAKDPAFIRSLGFSNPLPASLEGYLYPDTYYFDAETPVPDALKRMVQNFEKVWSTLDTSPLTSQGWKRQQIVTLASIIEKETGAPEERPMISSVFHNRLKKKMRLQSDPTTIYGLWEHFNGNLTRENLLHPTPYNTYSKFGLPVGPIANPGAEALRAAIRPATSSYLYFVSRNDGTHYFSETFAEHQKAVNKFQMDRASREGKSWRDLSKRTNTKPSSPR